MFGVKGMAVEPAGEIKANSGHHHLLINLGSIPAGETIPVDDTHLHFGKAQTEAEIKLPPGNYKLTMQFANGAYLLWPRNGAFDQRNRQVNEAWRRTVAC